MAIPSPSGQIKWTGHNSIENAAQSPLQRCWFFGKWRNGQKIARPRANRQHYTRKSIRFIEPLRSWIVVPVAPIVDEDLFEAAQEQLEQNRVRSSAKQGPTHLLQGLVVWALWLRLCSFG